MAWSSYARYHGTGKSPVTDKEGTSNFSSIWGRVSRPHLSPAPSSFHSSKGVAFHRTLTYINHHPESWYRFARYLMLLIIAYLNPNQPLDYCTNEAIFCHLFRFSITMKNLIASSKAGKDKNRWKVNYFRRKSTFLGKESTSPVKVVNCTQAKESTLSVWESLARGGGIWCVYHPK
jgi:hypothetical protein